MFVVPALALSILAIIWAVLGVHALPLCRLSGQWLQQRVHRPGLRGAGALLMVVSWNAHPPSLLVVGIGLVVLGHAVKPTR
ncbi:hypothetical protein [Streptomyces sp. BE147]|uniref:hypothetical protein n=1 Tax=unclassified Streptomyces TaxID=2593676 RepID=UPI002E78C987|nr:hypothetical protein [Streptomyces sp. BE147]MEE1737766.1 hypothetical protein [Streptomyces sp. BE147]